MTQVTEQALAVALAKNGFQNPAAILAARTAANLGLPIACAMLSNETGGGYNEWGHDPTNFIGGFDHITSTHWGETVTQAAYEAYKAQRDKNGLQGVGPCQLTSGGLQDEADAAGGCWVPQHNMAVGFHFLHDLIKEHGLLGGAVAYNGSGQAAEAYGAHLVALANHYESVGLGTTVGILD
jgi:hypothetical protein